MTTPEMKNGLAEVIAVGDEMITGQRLDTNSQWVSRQLAALGISTGWHSTVGDDVGRQTEVFRIAAERAAVVIVTGGLGPTADDLTRNVLSKLTGRSLVRDEESLRHIRSIFQGYGREMPESNVVQACLPEGATVIHNAEGTAPGIELVYTGKTGRSCRFFCLPGVPAEMVAMWESHVRQALLDAIGSRQVLEQRVLNCFGAGESQIESMLPGMIARGRNPQVGITASMATISLRIIATGKTREECSELVLADERFIRQKLGNLVFGAEEETLEQVVVSDLLERNWKLAISDAGLDGAVGQLLAAADPNGTVLQGATFARIPDSTFRRLSGTTEDPARTKSIQTAVSGLAAECAETFSADIAVGIGPIMPAGDNRQEFGVAIWSRQACHFVLLQHVGHSGLRHARSQKQVLNQLRMFLLQNR